MNIFKWLTSKISTYIKNVSDSWDEFEQDMKKVNIYYPYYCNTCVFNDRIMNFDSTAQLHKVEKDDSSKNYE